MMKIARSSAWSEAQIASFLEASVIPMRIATHTESFPTLCSIWYLFDAGRGELICASHEKSRLVTDLKQDNRCSFEIAVNDPPYRGVRGKATVNLVRENVEETFSTLIRRYLGSTDSDLATWLLSRCSEEYILRISPVQITAWDYSARMN